MMTTSGVTEVRETEGGLTIHTANSIYALTFLPDRAAPKEWATLRVLLS